MLEHRNEKTPDSTFLVWGNEEISYRLLNERVNRLANGLLGLGLRKGDKAIIHLWNSPEFIYSFFALLKIGAVTVLSNINHLAEELSYTVSHSESVFLITETEFYDRAKEVQGVIPSLRQILLADAAEAGPEAVSIPAIISQCSPDLRPTDVAIDDEATILYTSGTSSKPKGVLYVHGNHVFAGELFSKQIRLAPNDRTLCVIPLFHNNALMHQLLPVVTTGATMVLFKKFSASRFGDQVRENRVTVVTIPGALLKFILRSPEKLEDQNNSMRVIVSGANILSPEEYKQFARRFGLPLIGWYGQTESVVSPLYVPLDGKNKESSIGLPALGYDVRILDDRGEELPPGQMGEIAVRGMGKYWVMKEYYRDPAASAETLKDGWLHTGDLGYMDDEGYFYFLERKKEMIRVGGENVAAREVEMILNQHPGIAESAVIGTVDESGNETIKAFLVLKTGWEIISPELKEYCQKKMAKFKVPKEFEIRADLPRTAAGKIDKKALRKLNESTP